MKEDKLLDVLLSEQYFLQHWATQMWLDNETESKTFKRMEDRLKWVEEKIAVVESTSSLQTNRD